MQQIAYQDIQPALVGKIKIRLSSNELKLIDNIRGLITRSKYVQKADGKTYHYIAREHRVHIRTAKKWVGDYIKNGIKGLKIGKYDGRKPRIIDEDREVILSVLFNDPHIFGYLRNTWSLRSLSRCLTYELDIPISFKHLQRITKDMGIRCKRPKLELLHGSDYQEGRKRVEDYKRVVQL